MWYQRVTIDVIGYKRGGVSKKESLCLQYYRVWKLEILIFFIYELILLYINLV
jgi:hypothetical protein